MKLKHILILSFSLLAVGPLYIGLNYMHAHNQQAYKALVSNQLTTISALAKRRVDIKTIHFKGILGVKDQN